MPITFLIGLSWLLVWVASALAAALAAAVALSAGAVDGAAFCCTGLLDGTSLCSPGLTGLPLVSTGVSMIAFGPGTVGESANGSASTIVVGTSGEVAAGGDSAKVVEVPHIAPTTRMAAIP